MRHLLLVVCLGLFSTACPDETIEAPAGTSVTTAPLSTPDVSLLQDITTLDNKPAQKPEKKDHPKRRDAGAKK
jgi:hypothetical protein